MKIKMKILIVMGSLMLLVFALNLGVASAHSDANPNFQGEHADDPHPSPVGQNATDPDFPGKFNGFAAQNPDTNGNALAAIAHNPNCPAHHHDPE